MPATYNRSKVLETIQMLGSKLCDLGEDEINYKRLRIRCEDPENKVEEATSYIDVLQQVMKEKSLGLQPCLNDEDIQCIIEKSIALTGSNCGPAPNSYVQVDESQLEEWVLRNPRCVSYQDWERASYYFCDNLEIKLDITPEEMCNLVLEIQTKSIDPNVLLVAEVYSEVCDLNLKLDSKSDVDCKVEFKLLHEKLDCDIDLKTYIELIECNISFDLIKTVYENKLKLYTTVDKEGNKEVILKTSLNEYPLKSLSLKTELLDIPPNINKNKLMSEYKK